MSTTYKDRQFDIGGVSVFATQATLDEKVTYEKVVGLGYTADSVQSSRPEGSFSVDFYISDAFNINDFIDSYATEMTSFEGGIGDIGFASGYMTELSIQIEPLSLVKASVKGVFFSELDRSYSGIAESPLGSIAANDLAHGAKTVVAGADNEISFNLTYSQSISPKYLIGSTDIVGYKYDGGEIKVSANGVGLQRVIDFDCPDNLNDATIYLHDICGNSIENIVVTNMITTSSSITINNADDAVGSIEMIKHF